MDPMTLSMILSGGSAAIGGLGALMGLTDKAEIPPELQFSDESLQQNYLNSINLAVDNPSLYEEIMKNQRLIEEAQRYLAASRSRGLNQREQISLEDQQNQMANQIAMSGMGGRPEAVSYQADLQRRALAEAEQRAMAEEMQRRQMLAQQMQQGYGMKREAIGDVMNQNNMNRQLALAMDQMRNQQAMAQYQARVADEASRNQFYGNLFTGGMGAIGQIYGARQYGEAQGDALARQIAAMQQAQGAPINIQNNIPQQNRGPALAPPQYQNPVERGPNGDRSAYNIWGTPYGRYV
jgi:hypothetical protein